MPSRNRRCEESLKSVIDRHPLRHLLMEFAKERASSHYWAAGPALNPWRDKNACCRSRRALSTGARVPLTHVGLVFYLGCFLIAALRTQRIRQYPAGLSLRSTI